ncbi:MAG: M24 family metallopeptidase [Chlamydiota bacterium]|nr:M24 family metallopeptidase [Chlamydiota bacterium]
MGIQHNLDDIQRNLAAIHVDGWLIYDFRRSNRFAQEVLQIPKNRHLSRRFFYWIPVEGSPVKLVHSIESHVLDHLPGDVLTYSTWSALSLLLQSLLSKVATVAMEFSPNCDIPYISVVDGGTVDLVRNCGVTVVSSGDFLQKYSATLNEFQIQSHKEAADFLDATVEKAWELIRSSIRDQKNINEYLVQQYILNEFEFHGYMTSDPPICAVNEHSADPHYMPTENFCKEISLGDFVLIDLWCKSRESVAVYGDITRVGVVASRPSDEQKKIFDIVKNAREAAIHLVKARFADEERLEGWEVDQAARDVITAAGFEEYFIHRTGHNIGIETHGDGANMDNYETCDRRQVLSSTCFSIEPGIYLPGKFGVRLECDVVVDATGRVIVTGGEQQNIEILV